ncbi:MAG TPA: hypothetical protein VGE35_01810 [Candidatus Paceibacterota bacterium]
MKFTPYGKKSFQRLKKGYILLKDGAKRAFQAFSVAHALEAIKTALRLNDASHPTLKAANVVKAFLGSHTVIDFSATMSKARSAGRSNRWTIKKRPSRHPNAPSRRGALAFA